MPIRQFRKGEHSLAFKDQVVQKMVEKYGKNISTEERVQFHGRMKRFLSETGKTCQLYNTDCLSGMNLFPDETFDMIVTSPPYNLGIPYTNYDDTIPRSDYLEWIRKVGMKIKQKMKQDGSLFLNIGSSPTNPWGPFEVAMILKKFFKLQNVIHWIKSIYIENESYGEKVAVNVGHYKPIRGNRFLNNCQEYIFHFTKTGNVKLDRLSIGVPYKDSGNINRWENARNGLRCRGNTWYIPYKTIRVRDKDRPHPATFPVESSRNMYLSPRYFERHDCVRPFYGDRKYEFRVQKNGNKLCWI